MILTKYSHYFIGKPECIISIRILPILKKDFVFSNAALIGLPYMLERAGLDVQQGNILTSETKKLFKRLVCLCSKMALQSTEIQRNREFYKSADVRPPFTYASLIRQVWFFSHFFYQHVFNVSHFSPSSSLQTSSWRWTRFTTGSRTPSATSGETLLHGRYSTVSFFHSRSVQLLYVSVTNHVEKVVSHALTFRSVGHFEYILNCSPLLIQPFQDADRAKLYML